jgi:hypothetical protein
MTSSTLVHYFMHYFMHHFSFMHYFMHHFHCAIHHALFHASFPIDALFHAPFPLHIVNHYLFLTQTQTHTDLVQGYGGLHVTTNGSRTRKLHHNSLEGVFRFVAANAESTSVELQPASAQVWDMTVGVKINGKAWKIGTACFFDAQKFGIVKKMLYWKDRFQQTLILHLTRYTVETDGIQFWTPVEPDLPSCAIFWNQLTHKCKVTHNVIRRGNTMKSIVRVSTTQPHRDGFDFDTNMQ